MALHPRIGRFFVIGGAMLLAIGLIAPAGAADDPPGNNGTVKVDGWTVDNTPANEPHVGCEFGIDFYGYEAGLRATMVFEVQPPTGNAVIHTETGTLDDDDATGGGSEAGWDGHFDIDLADALAAYEPHPEQGYHLKLTVTVDDGVGGDAIVKHKVFWTTACEPPPTTTTTTTEPPTTTTTTEPPTTEPPTTEPPTTEPPTTEPPTTEPPTTEPPTTEPPTTEPPTTEPPTTEPPTTEPPTTEPPTTEPPTTEPPTTEPPTTTQDTAVAPTQDTRPDDDGTEVLGVELARTGWSATLLLLGGLLFVVGLALELLHQVARRRG